MKPINLSIAICAALAGIAPAWAQAPTDEIGVVKIAKGQPILIGYWLAVSGPAASVGIDSRRGIELAIEAKGKVLGHPVQLVGEDSACNPAGGVAAATRLASIRAILAAVGPSCSSESIGGAPILWKAGIPTVSPSSTAPRLTAPERGPTFDGYLRTAHNDNVQGRMAAEFAFNRLKAKTAATVQDGSAYSESLSAMFAETFKKLGGEIVAQEAIKPAETDMQPVLGKVAKASPEVIYYPVIAGGVGFTRQAKEMPALAKTQLMSSDAAFTVDFLQGAGPAATGMYESSPDVTPEALGVWYQLFLDTYRQKYGEKPPAPFHAQAYDAMQMIFGAIERVAKKDAEGNTYIGRKALRDALFATSGFAGLSGTLNCNPYGDCADPKIAIYRVESADPALWDPGKNPKKIYP